ncbi:MAG: hypothetical protein ACI8PZ_004089 [Myxococcota bacterium]
MRLWLGLGLLALAGCDDHVFVQTSHGDVDCDREPPRTWENYGRGEMGLTCAGCHSSLYTGVRRNGAPEGVDLDTLDGVVLWVDRVLDRTIDQRDMPPGGGLSEYDLAALEEWLVCDVQPRADAVR